MTEKRLTRSKAIRKYCLDCCLSSANEVKLCSCRKCPLYTYRLGYEVDEQGNRMARHKGDKNRFRQGEIEQGLD